MPESMVKNLDIVHLADMLSRDIREISKFQSSFTASLVIPPDRDRLWSYLGNYEAFVDWAVHQSRSTDGKFVTMDFPRTHPKSYDVKPVLEDAEDTVENESIRSVLRHINALRYECVTSQSSQLASGLLPADEKRFRDVIERLRRFIVEYVDATLPIDQPETSVTPNPQRR